MSGRLKADFDMLCTIGRDPDGGWSRLAYGEADCRAHDWLIEAGQQAGLDARYDAFGNVILRWGAADLPIVMLASHLDTVQRGGAYDGAIGVLAGLDVARRLAEQSFEGCAVEVVAFRDEEGRFGPFTGSRAMAGLLPPESIAKARSADGVALTEALASAGFDGRRVDEARRDWSDVAAYLELHIEQGPVLEDAGLRLGVVSAIAGQQRLSVRFTGRADHAGTAPMHLRRDAFAAAARFADRFRDLILESGDNSLRGTIGIVNVTPNQGNVVPGEVRLGLEIRDIAAGRVARAVRATEELADSVGADFGCEVRRRLVYQDDPVPMDASLREALKRSAARLGIGALDLPSGANHDAGIVGRLVPAAMLFVPSRDGRSHTPEEFTDWSDIALAADVLEATVKDLAEHVSTRSRRP